MFGGSSRGKGLGSGRGKGGEGNSIVWVGSLGPDFFEEAVYHPPRARVISPKSVPQRIRYQE